MSTHYRFPGPITTFGTLVGGSFIAASLLFLAAGRGVVLDPRLNNVISCLGIAGSFIGVKQIRDGHMEGLITYGRAFAAGFKILLLATALYSLYVYTLYTSVPGMLDEYHDIMMAALDAVGDETPFLNVMRESVNVKSPFLIATSEWFQKMLSGMFFLLVVAAILRRGTPSRVNTNP
jgi:hypothetical protein